MSSIMFQRLPQLWWSLNLHINTFCSTSLLNCLISQSFGPFLPQGRSTVIQWRPNRKHPKPCIMKELDNWSYWRESVELELTALISWSIRLRSPWILNSRLSSEISALFMLNWFRSALACLKFSIARNTIAAAVSYVNMKMPLPLLTAACSSWRLQKKCITITNHSNIMQKELTSVSKFCFLLIKAFFAMALFWWKLVQNMCFCNSVACLAHISKINKQSLNKERSFGIQIVS